MFDHFILDFDGVISNSFEVACEETNSIILQDYPMLPTVHSQDDLAYMYSGPLKTSLRRFGLTDIQSEDYFNKHSAAMQKRSGSIQVFDDVIKGIAELEPGQCSIVTSSYSGAVRNILERSPDYSEQMFLHISGRELKKTKTAKINDILSAINVPAQNALHIVDMVSDILYSRTVPIECCAVGWGYHPLSYLRVFAPKFWAETPSELFKIISQNILDKETYEI
jgi:phosphoglycolate phosphatase-like HAD superfamily hydrolase